MKQAVLFLIVSAVSFTACFAPPVEAQQTRPATVSQPAAVRQSAVKSRAANDCGDDCPDPSGRLAAPTGGLMDYDCAGGNCSCAGAKDCLAMKKICAPGTIGCNDYGCTCAEAEEPEGG